MRRYVWSRNLKNEDGVGPQRHRKFKNEWEYSKPGIQVFLAMQVEGDDRPLHCHLYR